MEKITKHILALQEQKLHRMKAVREPYVVEVVGKEVIVLPTVFYPATDTILLIETVLNENIITEKSIVLEPCAGTGVISLFLAEKAQRVVATDINKLAINNESKLDVEEEKLFDTIKKNPDKTTKEIFEIYKKEEGKAIRTFQKKLKSLEKAELIEKEEIKGIHGKSFKIKPKETKLSDF